MNQTSCVYLLIRDTIKGVVDRESSNTDMRGGIDRVEQVLDNCSKKKKRTSVRQKVQLLLGNEEGNFCKVQTSKEKCLFRLLWPIIFHCFISNSVVENVKMFIRFGS